MGVLLGLLIKNSGGVFAIIHLPIDEGIDVVTWPYCPSQLRSL